MKISEIKREKISEQILALLYSSSLKPLFTSQIAFEIARDEEFTKKILILLKNKNIVKEIKKNQKGIKYLRRSRWQLSDGTYQAYRELANN